jgi:hypothetical protein
MAELNASTSKASTTTQAVTAAATTSSASATVTALSQARTSRRLSNRNCLSATTSDHTQHTNPINTTGTPTTSTASRATSLNLQLQFENEASAAATASDYEPPQSSLATTTASTSTSPSARTTSSSFVSLTNVNNNSLVQQMSAARSREATAVVSSPDFAAERVTQPGSVSSPAFHSPQASPSFSLSFSNQEPDQPLASPTTVSSFKSDHSSNLLKMLDKMRSDKLLCDYEIRVNGKSFFCHKCILIAMSDFFRAMLTGSMKESRENFVELKGFSSTDGRRIFKQQKNMGLVAPTFNGHKIVMRRAMTVR